MPTTANNPENRADNLLPTDADSSADDGRFEIAEEVSLDQQSDSSRKIGQLADPDDGTDADAATDADVSEALAQSIEEKAQGGI